MWIGTFMKSYACLKPGFTIVELIVSCAILVMIAVGVVLQFRNLSPTQALENGMDVLRSTLVDLRTAGMTAQQCCGGTTPAGYGISIAVGGTENNTILYFADIDGDYLYTASDTLLRTTILQDNITINNCSTATVTTSTGNCTIVLSTAHDGTIYYNGAVASENITFALADVDATTSGQLNVYPMGFVIE